MNKLIVSIIIILVIAVGIGTYFIFQKPEVTANINVDYSKDLGAFSPYIFGTSQSVDNRQGYKYTREVGFKFLYVPTPLPQFISENYDFSQFDKDIAEIFKIGAEPLVMVPGPDRKLSDSSVLDNSIKKLAGHIKNKNNDKAWPNNGPVRIFRFGNEPDNVEFWKGTKQDFFETYATFAKTLKSVDSSFIIDGPGLMVGVDWEGMPSFSWAPDFLEYCSKNNVSVDMFSTHLYTSVPYTFYKNFGLLQAEVNKYPNLSPIYGTPRLSNDEWLIMLGDIWSGSYHKQFDTAWLASHAIAALINMVDQGLTLSTAMSGIVGGPDNCHDYSLIDCKGNGKPGFYAYKGFNQLANTTRISTTGHDHMNFAAIAGKNDNSIIVVVSNYDVKTYLNKYEPQKSGDNENPSWVEYNAYVSKYGEPKTYNKFSLTLNNLPWTSSQKIAYERYLVDESHKLELVESQTLSGSEKLTISEDTTAPSVQVIRLRVK